MSNKRGAVLVMCYLLVTVVLAFGSASLVRTLQEQNTARRSQDFIRAFHLAESGVDAALIQLVARNTSAIGPVSLAGGTYSATITQPNGYQFDQYLIQASGQFNGLTRPVQAVSQVSAQPVFRYAMFGYDWVDVGGSIKTNSFSSAACGGSGYSANSAGAKGNVGTNGTTSGNVDFDGNKLRINGTVVVGPTVADPTSIITDYDASLVLGSPKVDSQALAMLKPSVSIPAGCTTGLPPSVNDTRTFLTGVTYCPSGDQTVNGNETWTATGSVTIYLDGDLTINGNGVVGVVDTPTTMEIQVKSGDNVTIDGNGKLYGKLYAPNAEIDIKGNASHVYGSVIGKTAKLSGNAKLHYDQCLGSGGGPTGSYTVQMLSWLEP